MTTTQLNLVILMHDAPLIGIGSDDDTLHAIDTAELGGRCAGTDLVGVCGAPGLQLLPLAGSLHVPLRWPPPHRCAPGTRCRACWVGTGKPRPRSRMLDEGLGEDRPGG